MTLSTHWSVRSDVGADCRLSLSPSIQTGTFGIAASCSPAARGWRAASFKEFILSAMCIEKIINQRRSSAVIVSDFQINLTERYLTNCAAPNFGIARTQRHERQSYGGIVLAVGSSRQRWSSWRHPKPPMRSRFSIVGVYFILFINWYWHLLNLYELNNDFKRWRYRKLDNSSSGRWHRAPVDIIPGHHILVSPLPTVAPFVIDQYAVNLRTVFSTSCLN